jgi:hypothetical protein
MNVLNRKAIKQVSIYVALVLLGVLIASSLGSYAADSPPSAPVDLAPEPVAPPPQTEVSLASPLAAASWYTCTPVNVAAFSQRIHVKCSASVGTGIWYFAVPTSNAANAARMLSLLSTAHVAGRTLWIQSDLADTSGASIGCQTNDCRLIIAAEMH